jgi:hypothetical protein
MSAQQEGKRWERHKVQGDRLVSKIKELVHEGNVRRLVIRDDDGRVLIEAPLTVGVVGAVVAPVWAAIGAIAALVAKCSIEVEREDAHEDRGQESAATVEREALTDGVR